MLLGARWMKQGRAVDDIRDGFDRLPAPEPLEHVRHFSLQHETTVKDHIGPHNRGHIIAGRFVKVRVDTRPHDAPYLRFVPGDFADDIRYHSDGGGDAVRVGFGSSNTPIREQTTAEQQECKEQNPGTGGATLISGCSHFEYSKSTYGVIKTCQLPWHIPYVGSTFRFYGHKHGRELHQTHLSRTAEERRQLGFLRSAGGFHERRARHRHHHGKSPGGFRVNTPMNRARG